MFEGDKSNGSKLSKSWEWRLQSGIHHDYRDLMIKIVVLIKEAKGDGKSFSYRSTPHTSRNKLFLDVELDISFLV